MPSAGEVRAFFREVASGAFPLLTSDDVRKAARSLEQARVEVSSGWARRMEGKHAELSAARSDALKDKIKNEKGKLLARAATPRALTRQHLRISSSPRFRAPNAAQDPRL